MSFIGNAPADKALSSADINDGAVTPTKTSFMAGDGAIYLNPKVINANTSIPAGMNGHSVGPVEVNAIVTIDTTSRWVVE